MLGMPAVRGRPAKISSTFMRQFQKLAAGISAGLVEVC